MANPDKNFDDYIKRTVGNPEANQAEDVPDTSPDMLLEDQDDLAGEDEFGDRAGSKLSFEVPDECAGHRLDQALARLLPEYSRSRLQEWIANRQVSVDGTFASRKQKVWGGEQITVCPAEHPAELPYEAEDIYLEIVFEDDALLVINKPAGMVVHPGSGNWRGTLLNALLHHDSRLEAVPRAGIVHRLDKDTSGLLVVAKKVTTQTALVRQLAAHRVRREYLALVYGELAHGGRVDAPIGRHPSQRVKMAVVENGKPAVTHYQIEERFTTAATGSGCTLLRCRLETGRTHQIRVHLAYLHHPLVGDSTYLKGPQRCISELRELLSRFPRQALHATCLALEHPESGELMEWQSALPEDMKRLLQQVRGAIQSLNAKGRLSDAD
jgi:23S rRNA pseudouridine1911/1915/1917 synthase